MSIPSNFQESHEQVCVLIADFRAREAYYLSSVYQEAEARQDFIDKFWIALGWDVRHERQKNPYEQEVKVERGVTVGLAQKRADYAFFLGPNYRDPRFFCEAKKPSVKIREDRDAHFQTHRYGWNSQAPLSVLFDFQELVIVDCRRKPHIDAALTAAHHSYCYGDFEDLEKFGEIYWLFSREAVGTGKLDAYVAAMPKPKKTGKQLGLLRGSDARAVDASFLDDLETYRGDLARMLKNNNAELDGDTLTELVQRILDRLVFLRFLEDKLIETKYRVHDFSRAAVGQSWAKFIAASAELDRRYNGIVFKGHKLLDGTSLAIDDGDFADLCEELSHVRSPYDFNAIPVHILGSIYERFLGTVITTTDKRAKPELKPEVRKAGGVYYTPEYIVRYICEQTVGKLIEGKTPAQIEKLRFADIACGSGSFLLGVFDLLLRYHGRWYAEHPDAAKKENLAPATKNRKRRKEFIPAVVERDGLLCLTLEKKRQILLNNIYGVDLDPQAVEVAQLSLDLKLLEDETTASTRDDYLAFHEALLPSLSGNIKCGNSLIGSDILYGQFEFSGMEERKLRPMDFESAFPDVFTSKWSGADRVKDDADGFHVDVNFELQREAADYSERKPAKVEKPKQPPVGGGFDAIVGNPPYVLVQILNQPVVFDYLSRKYRAARYKVDTYHVFLERALALVREGGLLGYITPNTFLRNKHAKELRNVLLASSQIVALRLFFYQVFEGASVDTAIICAQKALSPRPDHAVNIVLSRELGAADELAPVLQSKWASHQTKDFSLPGGEGAEELVAKIASRGQPLGSFATAYFGIQTHDRDSYVIGESRRGFKPVVDGTHIERYGLKPGTDFVDYRPEAIKSGGKKFVYEQERIGVRQIGKTPIATLLPAGLYTLNTIYNIYATKPVDYSPKFVLGFIGSSVLRWFWLQSFFDQKDTFPKVKKDALLAIPIAKIDFTKPAQKAQHDRMVQLVETMLKVKAQVSAAKTESDRTYLEDKCTGLDRQIDQLVYELYGLTPEEIAVVENQTN